MILKMKRRIQGVATDYSYYLIFTLFILEVYALLLWFILTKAIFESITNTNNSTFFLNLSY